MSEKIAIVTCLNIPEPDVDEPLLMQALSEAGIQAELVAWDDEGADWGQYRVAIIRSTWDYPEKPEAFRSWLDRVSAQTVLLNDAQTAKWNLDKTYLSDLESKGIPIVPTVWFLQGGSVPEDFPWPDIVLKPTISAGSMLTERFQADDKANAKQFLSEQLAERAMMAQPYLPSVEQGGEVAWVWIDGKVTHGVKKAPRFQDGEESVSEAVDSQEAPHDLIRRIMEASPQGLLYARIDLMERDGQWLLSELELLEPSLFFKQNPSALDWFIQAVKKRIA